MAQKSVQDQPVFSVVTTLYHSAKYIDDFHSRIVKAMETMGMSFEIIMVNDGSPDDSLARALKLQERDPRVVVVDLSKNFGQHKSSMTGLQYARGEYIFLIEIDLEEQPEWIQDFYAKLNGPEKPDVVFGVQKKRKGLFFERATGQLFYSLFNFLSDVKIPENHITTRLMTKRYADSLRQFKDRELFIGGVYELVGFKQIPILVTKLSHSKTTYSMKRKLALLANAVTSFSTLPLTMISWAGFVISLFSSAVILWVVSQWWLWDISPGWASVVASVWFLGGVIMLSLGVLGMYVQKILGEVKDRPYTVVKQVHDLRKSAGNIHSISSAN